MYKYYLNRDDGQEYGAVNPIGTDRYNIQYKQQDGEIFYRPSLNNDIIITRLHDQSVYDAIIEYYELYQYRDIYFYIRSDCNPSKDLFAGVTTFRKAKVDKDKCQISFKFEVYDSYRIFLQNYETKFNIVNVEKMQAVRGNVYSYLEYSLTADGGVANGGYEQFTRGLWTNVPGPYAYARERINTIESGGGWYTFSDNDGFNYSIRHWNVSFPNLSDDVSWGSSPEDDLVPDLESILLYATESGRNWMLWESWRLDSSIAYSKQYVTLRLLEDVLDYVIPRLSTTINFNKNDYSLFFNTNSSSLTGASGFRSIAITQKSNMLYPGGAEASIADISFKELMNIFKYMFNAWWYIDSNNNFRIEYYGDLPLVTNGIDATLLIDPQTEQQYIKGTNSYSYKSSEIPQKEELLFMEADNTDFVGLPITYDVDAGNETVKQYSLQNITTDLKYIQTSPGSISLEGFVVLQTAEFDLVSPYFQILDAVGKLSGDTIINGSLSTANLMDKFWRINRQLKYGYLNDAQTQFDNEKKTKIGSDIKFPLCCTNFIPERLMKSLHGWGEIEEATLSLKDGWITVVLRFEDNSQL